jgi:hypothetical protein
MSGARFFVALALLAAGTSRADTPPTPSDPVATFYGLCDAAVPEVEAQGYTLVANQHLPGQSATVPFAALADQGYLAKVVTLDAPGADGTAYYVDGTLDSGDGADSTKLAGMRSQRVSGLELRMLEAFLVFRKDTPAAEVAARVHINNGDPTSVRALCVLVFQKR